MRADIHNGRGRRKVTNVMSFVADFGIKLIEHWGKSER